MSYYIFEDGDVFNTYINNYKLIRDKIIIDSKNNPSKVLNNYISLWPTTIPVIITKQYASLKI